jgi:hypothetical protein
MHWFWMFVEIGGGIGVGLFLAACGLSVFADLIRELVDQVIRLRISGKQ